MKKEAPKYATELLSVYLNKIAGVYSWFINIETASWKKLQTILTPIKWTIKSLLSLFITTYIERFQIPVVTSTTLGNTAIPHGGLAIHLPLSGHHQLSWRGPHCRIRREHQFLQLAERRADPLLVTEDSDSTPWSPFPHKITHTSKLLLQTVTATVTTVVTTWLLLLLLKWTLASLAGAR